MAQLQLADKRAKTGWASIIAAIPRQGIFGLVLIAIWWPVSWLRVEPFSSYYFFPIWLGYILTVDGAVAWRTKTSLWRRDHARFVLLFLASIPFWWVFEAINKALHNWHYIMPEGYGTGMYVLLCSLAFSTVLPAVLETGELVASFGIGRRLPSLPRFPSNRALLVGLHLSGWLMLAAALIWPRYCFPLAWLCLYFILEPINMALGQESIGRWATRGNWTPFWNIMLATLCCGFFWEMWNYLSLPKWEYTIPFVGFGKIFEMPFLGYSGYLPFGLENLAVFGLVFWLVFRRPQSYARLD